MVKLQQHQIECIDAIEKHFKKSSRQLIQLPTGSGKTYIFLSYLSKHSKSSLIICPTKELQEQIYNSALNFFHKSEISMKEDANPTFKRLNIWIAASLGLKNREKLVEVKFDHIVIDEAHRAMSKTYQSFVSHYQSVWKNFKLIGFTATPERNDSQSLLEIFETLTFTRNIYDLIKLGMLSDIEAHRIKTFQKFNKRQGANGDIQAKNIKDLDNETRNNIVLKTINKHCADKKTLIFCVSISHAENLSNLLKSCGYAADYVSGKMTKQVRQQKLKDFKSGKIQFMANCQLLTEGFDEPSIECLIMARPTISKALYCQMLGRGLRKFPGKDICYLYEITDNVHDICNFNVAGGAERYFEGEYTNGIKLTELTKELESLKEIEISIKKEKINLFNPLEDKLESEYAFEHQLKYLKDKQINFFEPINFLEAAFLIWKNKLKEKYGFN